MDQQGSKPSFSEELSEDELAQDWSLSHEELLLARKCRGDYHRLHFAVQLCCLRREGRFLRPFKVSLRISNFIYNQLGIAPVLIEPDGTIEEETRQDQEAKIRDHLGFVLFRESHIAPLQEFLIGLANEGVAREGPSRPPGSLLEVPRRPTRADFPQAVPQMNSSNQFS